LVDTREWREAQKKASRIEDSVKSEWDECTAKYSRATSVTDFRSFYSELYNIDIVDLLDNIGIGAVDRHAEDLRKKLFYEAGKNEKENLSDDPLAEIISSLVELGIAKKVA